MMEGEIPKEIELVPESELQEGSTQKASDEPKVPLRSLTDVESFHVQYTINVHKKKMKALACLSDDAYEIYKLSVICGICCKNLDIPLAMKSFNDLREKGLVPNNNTYYQLVSLVAGLGEQGSGSYPVREVSPPSDYQAALAVEADMRANNIPLTESCFTAMIRCYSANNQFLKALEVYNELKEHNLTAKLRTFNCLLHAAAECHDIVNGFAVYDDLVNLFHLIPSEREYLNLLALTIHYKDNRFHDILSQMMEDVLVPTSFAWETIREWFTTDPAYHISETPVDQTTGEVKLNGRKLLSIDLDVATRDQLLEQIESFALTRAREFQKGSNKPDGDRGNPNLLKWQEYKGWLRQTTATAATEGAQEEGDSEKRYTIVVDGANIGFYKTNYAGAPKHVDYIQIDWVVSELMRLGHRPLLILHQRHTKNTHHIPAEFHRLIDSWRQQQLLFETPSGWNDDWFWMYACVSLQSHIITNDEMRDHHFLMLSPRWFARWKERHVVHFSFGKWVKTQPVPLPAVAGQKRSFESMEEQQGAATESSVAPSEAGNASVSANGYNRSATSRQVLFEFPRVFSYRMQMIESPSHSDDSPTREYYIPASDRDVATWLAIVSTSSLTAASNS